MRVPEAGRALWHGCRAGEQVAGSNCACTFQAGVVQAQDPTCPPLRHADDLRGSPPQLHLGAGLQLRERTVCHGRHLCLRRRLHRPPLGLRLRGYDVAFEINHGSIHHDCMASALPALSVAHAQVPAMLMRLRSPGKTSDVGAHVPQTAGNYAKAPIPEFYQAPHLLQRGPQLGELALDGAELRMIDRRRRVAGILVQQQALARRAQRQRPLLRKHAWEATTDVRMLHCQP